MWFIIDDQMADDRRIRRLPLATVGLWVKLCVIHSKGVSMQAKDPAAYPGHFDKLDLKDAGGTMKQLQQLIDSGLMEEHDGGWRPVYAEGICREPRVLTEEQREARRKAGSKGGRRKAANQKAKQTSGDLPENSQANGEQNSSETGSKPSSKLLEDSQAKTWHKTDTDTDIPSPTPPAGTAKQTASEAPDAFAAIAETYPGEPSTTATCHNGRSHDSPHGSATNGRHGRRNPSHPRASTSTPGTANTSTSSWIHMRTNTTTAAASGKATLPSGISRARHAQMNSTKKPARRSNEQLPKQRNQAHQHEPD